MRSRVLLQTGELTLGDYACPAGDPLWDEVNDIGARPHVVFPRTAVVIRQRGRRPVLCTPNHVVFYRARQPYRRDLRDARGDRCLWLEVAPELLEQAAGGRVPGPLGPLDARTYLLAVGLARHLLAEPQPDRLVVEDAVLALLARAVRPDRPGVRDAGRRMRTRAAHAELAEAAKELLADRMTARPSLEALARDLHVSPFHLARVFRAQCGYSPAAYGHGLRLRAAVERLAAEPGTDLSRLAVELGYCSSSHFTDRFRAAFGRPPSALRATQLRTIVEVLAPAAP